MKARFLVALMLACSAQAAEPDAPMLVSIKPGETVPEPGFFIPERAAVAVAKRVASCEAERDALAKSPPVVTVALIIVGAVVVGAAAGAGVTYAVTHK